MTWYYLDGEERRGPFTAARMLDLLQEKTVTPTTPVWQEGMTSPLPFAHVPDLAALILEAEERRRRTAPWSRLIARSIDVMLFLLPLSVVLAYGMVEIQALGSRVLTFAAALIATSLIVLAALSLDGLVLASFGTTLGKKLYGLSVRRADGGRLSAGQSLQRSALIWIYGYGLNIPLINLVRLVMSFGRANLGQRCPWDEKPEYDVRQKPISKLRWGAGLLVLVLILGAPRLIGELIRDDRGLSWTNLVTSRTTRLPEGWQIEVPPQTDGRAFYVFNGPYAYIYLLGETAEGVDLAQYADYVKSDTGLGSYTGEAKKIDADGRSYSELTFSHRLQSIDYDVLVRIWQSGDYFWRIILFRPLRPLEARALADRAATALQRTLPPK